MKMHEPEKTPNKPHSTTFKNMKFHWKSCSNPTRAVCLQISRSFTKLVSDDQKSRDSAQHLQNLRIQILIVIKGNHYKYLTEYISVQSTTKKALLMTRLLNEIWRENIFKMSHNFRSW
jgi:hypothetical protein